MFHTYTLLYNHVTHAMVVYSTTYIQQCIFGIVVCCIYGFNNNVTLTQSEEDMFLLQELDQHQKTNSGTSKEKLIVLHK